MWSKFYQKRQNDWINFTPGNFAFLSDNAFRKSEGRHEKYVKFKLSYILLYDDAKNNLLEYHNFREKYSSESVLMFSGRPSFTHLFAQFQNDLHTFSQLSLKIKDISFLHTKEQKESVPKYEFVKWFIQKSEFRELSHNKHYRYFETWRQFCAREILIERS